MSQPSSQALPGMRRSIDVAARVLNIPVHQLRAGRIKGGLTNESWHVRMHQQPEQDVVVRISIADESALQLNRDSEACVLKLVEAAGIGAPVLYNAPHERLLVTRFVRAPMLDDKALAHNELLRAVAQLLRRLHALPLSTAERGLIQTNHLLQILTGYWHTLGATGELINQSDRERAEYIARESGHLNHTCLCHNDVHHLNLLGDAQRLWLLDWEYAGLGDPWFDLAAVCVYEQLDASLRQWLLQCYAGAADREAMQRLERMCWLFDYIRSLWLRVRQCSGGGIK